MEKGLTSIFLLTYWITTSCAVTLFPPLYLACDGEEIEFTCTTRQTFVRWNITTPRMNYPTQDLTRFHLGRMPPFATDDSVFTFRTVSYTSSTMKLVTTVSVNASWELDGTMVQCLEFMSGEIRKETAIMRVTGVPTAFNLTLPATLDLEFGTTSITAVNVSWTRQDGAEYNIFISPPIPYSNASRTSIIIPNVPFNVQYNVTVVAHRCHGSYTSSATLNYTRCIFPSIDPTRVRLVPDVMGVASSPEGGVISFLCISASQVLVGIDNATCVEGMWNWPGDVDAITCRGECGLPVLGDDVVLVDNFTTSEGSSFNFSCADGLSPTAIINTICTADSFWSPDPEHIRCINASAISTTTTVMTTALINEAPPMSTLTILTVICSIAFFIVGLVGGIACGCLVAYCCNGDKHNLQPSQPPLAPFYEDIILPAKEELELKDNVAYGHFK